MAKITSEDRLVILGLFTLARRAAMEAESARRQIAKIIGVSTDEIGNIDDAIFANDETGSDALDEALKRNGVEVSDA